MNPKLYKSSLNKERSQKNKEQKSESESQHAAPTEAKTSSEHFA